MRHLLWIFTIVFVGFFGTHRLGNSPVESIPAPAVRFLAAANLQCVKLFELEEFLDFDPRLIFGDHWWVQFTKLLERPLEIRRFVEAVTRAYRVYESDGKRDPNLFFQKACDETGFKMKIRGKLPELPADRPVVFVSNHPTGALDGIFLMKLATQLRPQTKLVATQVSRALTVMQEFLITVNKSKPEGKNEEEKAKHEKQIQRENVGALMTMFKVLKANGSVALFPAGEISHWDVQAGKAVDSRWNELVGQFVKRYNAIVIPVNIQLENSILYYHLGKAQNPSMFLDYRNLIDQKITTEVIVGEPVTAEALPTETQAIADKLKEITESLDAPRF